MNMRKRPHDGWSWPRWLRQGSRLLLLLPALAVLVTEGLSCISVKPRPGWPLEGTIGIDIDIMNGQLSDWVSGQSTSGQVKGGDGMKVKPITLYVAAGRTFHINQLRFSAQVIGYPAADVLKWLQTETEFATMDWSHLDETFTEAETAPSGNNINISKSHGWQNANWMNKKYFFTVTICTQVDATNKCTPASTLPNFPLILEPENYVINRATAITRSNGMVSEDNVGVGVAGSDGKGTYKSIQLQSGGTYNGPRDEMYVISVVCPPGTTPGPTCKPGKLDGTAYVTVGSITGLDSVKDTPPAGFKPIPVKAGEAIPLGAAGHGATITFTDDTAPLTENLAIGDRWIVRCFKDKKQVTQVEPSTKADWQGSAEVRFSTAAGTAPTFKLPTKEEKGYSAAGYYLRVAFSGQPDPSVQYPRASGTPPPNLIEVKEPKLGYGLKAGFRLYKWEKDIVPPGYKESKDNLFQIGDKVKIAFSLTDDDGTNLLVRVGADGQENQDCILKDDNGAPITSVKDPVTGIVKDPGGACMPSYDSFNKKGDCQGADRHCPGFIYFRSPVLPGGHGFFNEHRVNVTQLYVAGPKHLIEQYYEDPAVAGPPKTHLLLTAAFPVESGQTSGCATKPEPCQKMPKPEFEFVVPPEAKPGTYVTLLKLQRTYLGQRTYRIFQTEFQIGTAIRSDYVQKVGNCATCHVGEAGMDRLRHWPPNKEDYACVICHNRPRAIKAVNVHNIHFHSPTWPTRKQVCSLCHLVPGSNLRASKIVCGACHDKPTIQAGHFQDIDEYESCGANCHNREQTGHVPLPPL